MYAPLGRVLKTAYEGLKQQNRREIIMPEQESCVSGLIKLGMPKIKKSAPISKYPLSSTQTGIFFLSQMNHSGLALELCYQLILRGIPDDAALEKALYALEERHPVLKT